MENRANFAIVGLFALAVLAGAFGFIYWFQRAGEGADRKGYQVVFIGSVSGLSRGSAVRFNGLRVGEVIEISIMPNDPGRVIAVIEVDRATPVREDTRARLETQVLTGLSMIQLSGGSPRAAELTSIDTKSRPMIPADRSDYQDILETAQRLSGRMDSVLTRIDGILGQAEGPILSSVRNVEAFTRALSENSSGVAAFLTNIGEMSQKVGALSARMETFVDGAEALMRGLDAAAINRSVANIASVTDTFAENKAVISSLITDAGSLARQLNQSSGKLDSALDEITRLARAIDAQKLNRALDGAEQFTSMLGRNTATVDSALQEFSRIADQVSKAASKLDNVMAGAETFFGSGQNGQTAGLIAEITEAAKSFKLLANNLDIRTREMTVGINRFTGPGLREIESLAAESRKAVNDLGRAVRSLERNPSQLLFGGQSTIPERR